MNVVLVVTDQQRYDSLGCTGNSFALTPNLDALAGESTVFSRHMSCAPVCMPSRISLMTGRYPASHGVWNNGTPLPSAANIPVSVDLLEYQRRVFPSQQPLSHVPTLAEIFASAGYVTGAAGKLHLSPYLSDARQGFQESIQRWSEDPGMVDWHGPYYGFQEVDLSMDHGEHVRGHYAHWLALNYPELAAKLAAEEHPAGVRFPEVPDLHPGRLPVEAHPTTWVAARACDFLGRRAADRKPFFLSVGIPDPHHPFTPPASLAELFETHDVLPVGAPFTSLEAVPEALRRYVYPGRIPLRPEAIRLVRQYTDAMIHLIDRAVGQIVNRLKRHGLWEDTIFVFTSDHGDYLGDYGLIRKTNLASRALNHTPLILRAPGCGQPGMAAIPACNVDILPTLCELANIPTPAEVQGESLLGVLAHGRRQPVMIQSATGNSMETNLSLVDERYRFTLYPSAGFSELYDHASDPSEQHSLSNQGLAAEKHLRQDLLEAFAISTTPPYGRVALW